MRSNDASITVETNLKVVNSLLLADIIREIDDLSHGLDELGGHL